MPRAMDRPGRLVEPLAALGDLAANHAASTPPTSQSSVPAMGRSERTIPARLVRGATDRETADADHLEAPLLELSPRPAARTAEESRPACCRLYPLGDSERPRREAGRHGERMRLAPGQCPALPRAWALRMPCGHECCCSGSWARPVSPRLTGGLQMAACLSNRSRARGALPAAALTTWLGLASSGCAMEPTIPSLSTETRRRASKGTRPPPWRSTSSRSSPACPSRTTCRAARSASASARAVHAAMRRLASGGTVIFQGSLTEHPIVPRSLGTRRRQSSPPRAAAAWSSSSRTTAPSRTGAPGTRTDRRGVVVLAVTPATT